MEQFRRLGRELPEAPALAIRAGAEAILAEANLTMPRRSGTLASTGRVETWTQGDTHGATILYGGGIKYTPYAMFQRRNYRRTPPGEAYALFKAADRLRAGIEASFRLAVDATIARIMQ
jgi:hypothetical protein